MLKGTQHPENVILSEATESSFPRWGQSTDLTYLQSFGTGAFCESVGYGPISRKIYLSLM